MTLSLPKLEPSKLNFTPYPYQYDLDWNLIQGGCPDVNMVSKRGAMEKKKAMALQSDRQFFGSDYSSSYGSDYGSDYGFDYGSGSD